MKVRHAAVVAGLALGLISGTARAELLHFDLRTSTSELSFNLASTPMPSTSNVDYSEFNNVALVDNGISEVGTVTFFANSAKYDGGIYYSATYSDYAYGTQIFSGSTAEPTFSENTYILTQGSTGLLAKLTVTPSTVPLPSSAPMFGAALMALGAIGYGVKRKGKAAAAT